MTSYTVIVASRWLFQLGLLLLLLEQLIRIAACLWAIPGSRGSILLDDFFAFWLFLDYVFVALNRNDFDFNFCFFDLLFDWRIFKWSNVIDFCFNIGFFSFGFVFGNEVLVVYVDCGCFNWRKFLWHKEGSSRVSIMEFQNLRCNQKPEIITFLWHRNDFLRGSYGSHPPACQGQAIHLWCQSLHCFDCWSLFHCIALSRAALCLVKVSIL